MRRAVGAWTLLVLAVAACGTVPSVNPAAGPSSTSATTNVTGTLDRGPVPTCPAGEPCDPPMVAYRLVFSEPGVPDVAVRVNGDGTFALHLDPGVYTIAAEPPAFGGKLVPSAVRVPATGTVYLQLRIARSS